jgi:hypothetical protein
MKLLLEATEEENVVDHKSYLLYVLFYHVCLNFYQLENFLALHPYKLNDGYAHTRFYEAKGGKKFMKLIIY